MIHRRVAPGWVGAAVAVAALAGPWVSGASAAPALPGYYTATANVQGVGFFATFPGSLVSPIASAAVPLAVAEMDWAEGVAGMATVVYPGALPLVYQDAALLLAPQAAPVQPLFPKYPLIVQGSPGNRAPEVGAPSVEAGPMRAGLTNMSCSVPEDDSGVACQARMATLQVGAAQALAPPGLSPAQARLRLDAFKVWRSGLLNALRPVRALLPPLAEPSQDDKSLFSFASLVAESKTSVGSHSARANSALTMGEVGFLGGVLRLDSLVQRYEAVSDRGTAKATGVTEILGASLGGVPVRISPDGVLVAEQPGMGKEQIEQANGMLADALTSSGLVVRGAQQRDGSSGNEGAIGGDGLYVQATMGFQADGVTTGFWLGTGGARAAADDFLDQVGDVVAADSPEGPGAPAHSAAAHPSQAGLLRVPLRSLSSPAGTDGVAPSMVGPILPPAPASLVGASDLVLGARPAASVRDTTRRAGLGRTALVGLVGVVQALGLAAITAYAWRTHVGRREW